MIEIVKQNSDMSKKIEKFQIYQHYKGELVIIVDILTDADTFKEIISFQFLKDRWFKPGKEKTWSRTKDSFLEEKDGIHKYTLIKEAPSIMKIMSRLPQNYFNQNLEQL